MSVFSDSLCIPFRPQNMLGHLNDEGESNPCLHLFEHIIQMNDHIS